MPRVARIESSTGIYHIMMRGNNRQTIFTDEEDNIRFIKTLQRYQKVSGYELYAYCLMGNHVHLLLKEVNEPLGITMRRIISSYVIWYNRKHDRIGHLFQGRFKSEPVENDAYLLTVIRYIFQNPVKAKMVRRVGNYKWSNYIDYLEENNNYDTAFVLSVFDRDKSKARQKFVEFVNQKNADKCIDIPEQEPPNDTEAIKIIKEHYGFASAMDIQKLEPQHRNICLKEFKEIHGLTIRQIERLTGVNRGIVQRA